MFTDAYLYAHTRHIEGMKLLIECGRIKADLLCFLLLWQLGSGFLLSLLCFSVTICC